MLYSVDRLEGAFAVLEGPDGALQEVALSELPAGVREGDLLRRSGEGFVLDPEATRRRRKTLFERQNRLFENPD